MQQNLMGNETRKKSILTWLKKIEISKNWELGFSTYLTNEVIKVVFSSFKTE